MKILIRALLLAIVIFLSLNELNASENEESSSRTGEQRITTHRGAGRPRGRQSRRQDGVIQGEFRIKPYYRQTVSVTGPSWGFLQHRGQNIEVWLDNSGRRIIKADYPSNACPTGPDYQRKNFLVRLTTIRENLQIVEYVNQNGTLLGVKAPKPTTANVMEPNNTQWFIVYCRKYYRVRINPVSKEVESITLASKNEHEVVQGRKAEFVDMAGFKFFLIKDGPDEEVTGGEPVTRSILPLIS